MIERNRVSTISITAICTGILLNPPFLGFVFSPTGTIESLSHILFVVLAEIFLVAGGVWAYVNRIRLSTRGLVMRGCVAFLVLVSIEVGLHVAKYPLDYFRGVAMDYRMNLSVYRDQEWAGQLFKEYHETRLGFDQYIGWKTEEYHGTYLNVDGHGLRRTINAETSAPSDSVFVFGGSSIWGAFVRDENTVPSQLSRMLKERGRTPIVYNYAQPGYTFTQGLLQLILLLKDGRRPGVVVFCDGFNDVLSAYNTGQAGRIGLYHKIKNAIETRRLPHRKQMALIILDFIERHSMMYRGVDRFAILLFSRKPGTKYEQQQRTDLSAGVVKEYTASLGMLDSLSRIYGFRYRCFLQPIIYTKTSLTEEERLSDSKFNDPEIREMCLSTYGALEHLALPNLETLSHVFDGHEGTYFSDLCHLSEAGNQLVANEIMRRTFALKPIP